jgi:hypothetical protein
MVSVVGVVSARPRVVVVGSGGALRVRIREDATMQCYVVRDYVGTAQCRHMSG